MSSINTDTVIHYLHRQESPNQYRVSFFRTAEERNSEADKWRLSHCKVDDPRSLFPSWYPVQELAYA